MTSRTISSYLAPYLPCFALCFAGLCSVSQAAELINLYDSDSLAARQPLMIAHRGGVVREGVPENSLPALRLAAEQGYGMVEVDVRATRDGVPVAFHDDELEQHVGVSGRIEDLSFYEVSKLRYHEGERVLSLDEYLREAAALGLGIMLDIKTDGDPGYYDEIAAQLARYHLNEATLTISRKPGTVHHLAGQVMHRVSAEQEQRIANGETLDLNGLFWFGWPRYISNERVAEIQTMGALVVPSINVFHYPEAEHMQRAEEDIRRMYEAGVDAYQIDGVYGPLVEALQ